jgi:hypothetical protein
MWVCQKPITLAKVGDGLAVQDWAMVLQYKLQALLLVTGSSAHDSS